MNFSQRHSGTKVQCESCLFSQGKTPEFTKRAKFMNFSFWPFLWFGLLGRLLTVWRGLQNHPATKGVQPKGVRRKIGYRERERGKGRGDGEGERGRGRGRGEGRREGEKCAKYQGEETHPQNHHPNKKSLRKQLTHAERVWDEEKSKKGQKNVTKKRPKMKKKIEFADLLLRHPDKS